MKKEIEDKKCPSCGSLDYFISINEDELCTSCCCKMIDYTDEGEVKISQEKLERYESIVSFVENVLKEKALELGEIFGKKKILEIEKLLNMEK